jgi:hypothetical protein
MNNNVLIIGIVVGCVNYLFRYLPLRLRAGHSRTGRRARQRAARYHRHRLHLRPADRSQRAGNPQRFPAAAADAGRLRMVLGLAFWKTRSIIIPTLLSALAYG